MSLFEVAHGNLLQSLERAVAHTAIYRILIVAVGEYGGSIPTELNAAVLAFSRELDIMVKWSAHLC